MGSTFLARPMVSTAPMHHRSGKKESVISYMADWDGEWHGIFPLADDDGRWSIVFQSTR